MSFQQKRIIVGNYYTYRTPQRITSYHKNSLKTWILITFGLWFATVCRLVLWLYTTHTYGTFTSRRIYFPREVGPLALKLTPKKAYNCDALLWARVYFPSQDMTKPTICHCHLLCCLLLLWSASLHLAQLRPIASHRSTRCNEVSWLAWLFLDESAHCIAPAPGHRETLPRSTIFEVNYLPSHVTISVAPYLSTLPCNQQAPVPRQPCWHGLTCLNHSNCADIGVAFVARQWG